ncbi:molybdopterin molybdenumtransferase MoeA [Bacillus mangrovi]|uniref:Molybdopterin molybdenumtransferase n=1 Tax=Metabacillus mangrovi TaxID=1491830 RepID=A0A7X2S270_9BACI|nr:gephyrin-like molybdotransferase Glp [Metabacillus mangrovi]MTH51925.1 molybdopterin molybdenumtransferase MoeA [Metabacillus mangrovi]
MAEKRTPIPIGEAVSRVMEYAEEGAAALIPIEESFGRVLAEDLTADHDVPAFDRSPYDGFAIRAEDTQSKLPAVLEVAGEIGAGSVYPHTAKPDQAVRIMTGAAIPEGFDAVVMIELVKEHTKNEKKYIEVSRSYSKGDNLSFRGEDAKKGQILAGKGTFVDPGVTALLATFGYQEVPVASRPSVGVIATGSELLDPEAPLEPGKIRNSNAYMLLSQIRRAGADPVYFGKVADDFEACFQTISRALKETDMLITTGGVSVGDYDYLPDIYKNLGANVLFNKVAMRPGSVTTVAEKDGKLLFGLSGNPSACYVGFELFARPVIRRTMGNPFPHLKRIKAILGADFKKANPFTRLVRGRLKYGEGGTVSAVPAGFNKSSSVSSLAAADVFILLPGGTRGYEKGMTVDALLVGGETGSGWPWENILPSYR